MNDFSNALGDCQLFGHGLTTVVREASFDLCGDHQELGVGGLDMVVGGIHHTIFNKNLAICVRHLFGKCHHELGVGGCDLGLDGLRPGKVCGRGTDGCSNALGDCQLFGRGLPTVVGEASFDLCGDHQDLGVGGLDMVVGGLH